MRHGLGRHNYRSPGSGIAVAPPVGAALGLAYRGLAYRTISFEPLGFTGWFYY